MLRPVDTHQFELVKFNNYYLRERVLKGLTEMLPLRQRELNQELNSKRPNPKRIDKLQKVIYNISETLAKSAQRTK